MKNKIIVTPDELHNVNSLLRGIMDTAFDASCIMDKDGYIVHCSKSSPLIWNVSNEQAIGMHITELDSASPYPELLKTGKPILGKIHIINGMTCVTHMIPLFDEDSSIVGAFGVIIFRGIEKLKHLVRESIMDHESEALYNQLSRAEAKFSLMDFIGETAEVKKIQKIARKAAKLDSPILIRGETGCGKEILANGIHAASVTKFKKPFVKINCTAIPRDLLESELFGYEKGAFTGAYSTKQGKFEIAGKGTILLDEIGDLSISMQSKLLRVIEEREFERVGGNKLIPLHARIIASTNRNLEELVSQGTFREDLYYRLSTIEIIIPPLRERKEDIPLLLEHFLLQNNLTKPFTQNAIKLINNYDWPGNVRQLKNMVTRLSVIDDNEVINEQILSTILKLPAKPLNSYPALAFSSSNTNTIDEVYKNLIILTLQENNMSISATARSLGISRNTLYNKMKKLNISLKKDLT